MGSETPRGKSLAHKVEHELRQYALISAYLYVCFGALIFYKTAILQGQGISFVPFGLAAIKALVLGKFILLGHAVGLGERGGEHRIIYLIIRKALLFLVMLLVLSVIEEAIAGIIHGQTVTESIPMLQGGSLLRVLATSLIMLLILIPYLAFGEINEALGEGVLKQILFESRSGHRAGGRRQAEQGGPLPNDAPISVEGIPPSGSENTPRGAVHRK